MSTLFQLFYIFILLRFKMFNMDDKIYIASVVMLNVMTPALVVSRYYVRFVYKIEYYRTFPFN